MIEVWLQITCDGCGTTTNSEMPNMTRKEFLSELPRWRSYPGDLHYCGSCVQIGNAKNRVTGFGMTEEPEPWEQKEK